MYERLHHRLVERVLLSLDDVLLARRRCFFGGGTAIALAHGEFRESVDIDFLIADADGYRGLRDDVRRAEGLTGVTRPGALLTVARDVRIDQYGIRTFIDVDGVLIKVEFVREARIDFDPPDEMTRIGGVLRLSDRDLAASKLLANADRWADDSVFSRDLIDLAMMDLPRREMQKAKAKAGQAYSSIERDLRAAVDALGRRRGRLERCLHALQVMTPLALVWGRIKRLPERVVRPGPIDT
jgi:hypothetical protein